MITSTGKDFDPFNPKPEDIDIEDIARGLSRACRFAGQLREGREFYSVAQHSVIMAKWAWIDRVKPEICIQILLHDASEAIVNDLVTEVKQKLPDYLKLEQQVQAAILKHFTGSPYVSDLIKVYDKRMLHLETMFLMPVHPVFSPSVQAQSLPTTILLYPLLAIQELWYPKGYKEE